MLIKNRFGRIVQVSPERADEMILKGDGFKLEGSEVKEEKAPIETPVNELVCPYCGKECKSKLGFNKHTATCKKKAL